MIMEVWEVYRRDSQECVIYKTEELARNQDFFDEVDLIGQAKVDLPEEEIALLNEGKPIYCG